MLFKLEQDEQPSGTAEEWVKCFPVGRRIGPDKLKKKFPALVKQYGFDELCARTRAFTESHLLTERKFIPHPMTWINRGGLEEDLTTKEIIENPHSQLDIYCDGINAKYKNSQQAKGNWTRIAEITDGKEVIDKWLKSTRLGGWDKWVMITDILSAMKCGTIVTSFNHWRERLR